MTPSEYSELVDFLGRKFDAIDRRFEQIDRRFEQIDRRFEQIDRRFEQIDQRFERLEAEIRGVGVLAERNQTQIQLLAEKIDAQTARLDAFQAEVRGEFAAVRREMKAGFDAVHARVDRLEAA